MQDFEELYAQYYARIFKYVMSLCHDPVLAEEITQDAFFRAFKSIGSFKGECQISSWLCQIAKNCYFSHVKREKKLRIKEIAPEQPDTGIEAQFIDRETAQGVHRILHGLREPYKEVFWLRHFGELGFQEIGGLFGKSESWARVTYYRAKMMIREEIK